MKQHVRIAIVFGPLAAAFAQFSQPAVTDDGRQVYFISPLILSGAPPDTSPASHLYRFGPDGISLASASASLPQISADGTIVGFTDPQFCTTTNATTACGQEGKLLGPPEADLGPGSLQISRNGRWALLASPAPPNQTANATLIDIGSGARTEIPPPPLGTMVALAFDGTVLVRQPAGLGFNQIGLWRQGQFMPISISQPGFAISFTALSDDAGTVIYNATAITSGAPAGNRLVARNLAAGMDTVLYTGQASGELPRFMGASRDARYVLFRVMTPAQGNGPAYIADTVTGQNQPIPLTDGELVTDGTLSGSGNFAILTTTMGRILRVPWNAGTLGSIEPLVPATPYLRVNSGPFSPGSLAQLSGSISNFVQDWQGRVLLDDRPLFVLAVKPGEVDVQVPWEQPTGTAHFRLNLAASVWPGSPFVENQPVFVSPVSPGFLPLPDPQTSILGTLPLVRGDFSGLLTTQPQPGDIINLYLTGLGPAQGTPVTGQPAPLDHVLPIQGTLTCRFTPQTTDAQTLFAGLAPGMIGIYQVTFQMPNDPNQAPLNGMQCHLDTPNGGAGFGIGILGLPAPSN